ncbi:hypothetical protein ZIOFF_071951 [Zingiber officinale]|uniref:Uncharacterized protein n=1 Tax=Zingiber officinale TaxID=94328 RepID=A0A8J5CV16_ZINOF|nr:hypothetical protein ZIOFF_071951 [Zingiber officinale]
MSTAASTAGGCAEWEERATDTWALNGGINSWWVCCGVGERAAGTWRKKKKYGGSEENLCLKLSQCHTLIGPLSLKALVLAYLNAEDTDWSVDSLRARNTYVVSSLSFNVTGSFHRRLGRS